MQNNYDRLFKELTQLIEDDKVYQNLDEDLKARVNTLFLSNEKNQGNLIMEGCMSEDPQILFPKTATTAQKHFFQSKILRDTNTNLPFRKYTITSSNQTDGRIQKKIEVSAFNEERKSRLDNKKGKFPQQNKSKSQKDLIKYNTFKSKSKSKEKLAAYPRPAFIKAGIANDSKKKSKDNRQKNLLNNQKVSQKQNFFNDSKKDMFRQRKNRESFRSSKSRQQLNSRNSQGKTKNRNFDESKQILKKLATMQTQPSRVSLSLKSKEKDFKEPQQDLSIIDAITKKQEYLNNERMYLQSKIREMKQAIEDQKDIIESKNISIQRINQQIAKKQDHQKSCSQQIKISRKKSENFISESRKMQNKILEANKSKDNVVANIEQQKYLINMYVKVIEQIRNQLKIEQSEKLDLIKHLVSLKNTEKMSMQKYLMKQAASQSMFINLNSTLKKWG